MIYIIIVISIILADQSLKKYAEKHYKDNRQERGNYKLYLVKNYGAFRGLFRNRKGLLLIIQSVGTLLVSVLFIHGLFTGKGKLYNAGLALLLGGAIGNLIDRIKKGYVRDYIAFKWTKNLYYNLADFMIFIGAILTMMRAFLKK